MSAPFRRPAVNERLGLGVGMDLAWGAQPIGFERTAAGDRVAPAVRRFLRGYADDFEYLFFAFQPRDRDHLHPDSYAQAYGDLFDAADAIPHRAFHHTLLNMGAVDRYDATAILEFTNALCERYHFLWIVEDLGIWSIGGKPLPYPLPPILTNESLDACVRRVATYQRKLRVPLCVEFPGVSDGASFLVGDLDLFDFFREVVERTQSAATLDVGHILGYQWMLGRRGARIFESIERLPLEHCFEIHLSGCRISRGRFRDLHHGVLLDEQLELLEHLLERCPNLSAITYEDPRYSRAGKLVRKAEPNYARLRELAGRWARS